MDVTATTTPSERSGGASTRPRASTQPSSPVSAILGLVVGGLLLWMGTPQLVAALVALDADAALQGVRSGSPGSPDQLAMAGEALTAANRWEKSGEREAARAVLLTFQAQGAPPGPDRDRLSAEALAAASAAVRLAPGQPHAWAHLATLLERGGDRKRAVEALRLSILSGAVEPALMMWRIETALRLRGDMDAEALSLLRRQIRLAWIIMPDEIAALSKRPDAHDLVTESLSLLNEEEMAHYVRLHGKR
ncbi:hypothetical protein [Azospirillum oryzae]|uniref:hypothetical protein n=1 Tax=Azospirillum oryzae TaxID=286727 RepID=UPI00125C614D|nr:hypothetical protein [Azospirillum oryzae]KAA0586608.1 hypothetical protein FZ938_20640 [Azospirillum oryzae]GLR82358.1 hypothetical protein GCM10007856_50530 [Azospirillum oryzae]